MVEAVAQGETVSALEEYQLAKEMFNECVLSETADAAIAELEAAWQQEHTKRADLIVDLQRMTNRAEQAEAALAERDGRRCETCCHEHNFDGTPFCTYCDFVPPDDFACNRWTARAEEGRE